MYLPSYECLVVAVIFHVFPLICKSSDVEQHALSVLKVPEEFPINHIALYGDYVYVSAVNRIYQLNKNLQIYEETQTGPHDRKPYNCEINCDELVSMDNYNKLFLIDSDRSRIISCGSVDKGACETRKLSNTTEVINVANLNDPEKSFVCPQEIGCDTHAVISEGPYLYGSPSTVMYVATGKGKPDSEYGKFNNRYRYISTRSLEQADLFEYATGESSAQFSKKVDGERDFKYVFETGDESGFIYFVFQQSDNLGKQSHAWLSRICKSDQDYYSYLKLNITCSADPQKAVKVTAAKYLEDGLDTTDSGGGILLVTLQEDDDSVLCSFSLNEINRLYDDTQLMCFQQVKQNVSSVMPEAKEKEWTECNVHNFLRGDEGLDAEPVRTTNGTLRCGAIYLPTMLMRLIPVVGNRTYVNRNTYVTTLVKSSIGDVHEVFMGTQQGGILQYDIMRNIIYNKINMGSPILPDIILEPDNSLIIPEYYVITGNEGTVSSSNKVFRMTAANCGQFESCEACKQAKNPHCGWCILEHRCMPKLLSCTGGSLLSPFDDQCINANVADAMERTTNATVVINLNMLPSIASPDFYTCVFDDSIAVGGTLTDDPNIVHCLSPSSAQLRPNFPGKDYVEIKLAIRYNSGQSKTDIVSTSVTFYECAVHGDTLNLEQPCKGCIMSWDDKCTWCVNEHKCQPTMSAQNRCLLNDRMCPRITSIDESVRLISVKSTKAILFYVENMFMDGNEYQCKLDINGTVKSVPAKKVNDQTMECFEDEYNYISDTQVSSATLAVSWRKDAMIDMLPQPQIQFYKCYVGRTDCTLCVTADPKFQCGWCDKLSLCTIEDHCVKDSQHGVWLTDSQQCPPPQITNISPSSGPLNGGTSLSIFGINMGITAFDVASITVSGVECIIMSDGYEVSRKVLCQTGESFDSVSGPVSMVVRGRTISSQMEFIYRNPVLGYSDRIHGPQAGGTKITLNGTELDTGMSIEVFIGSFPCQVTSTTMEKYITCITPHATKPIYDLKISAIYDGSYTTISHSSFSYTENPEISSFKMKSDSLASFESGGREIVFAGSSFDSVQNPQLLVKIQALANSGSKHGNRTRRSMLRRTVKLMMRNRRAIDDPVFTSDCNVINSTMMSCGTPEVSMNGSPSAIAKMFVKMDNHVVNLDGSILFFENPSNFSLLKDKEIQEESVLEIRVQNLNMDAVTKSEISVMIADVMCVVESITDQSILCRIPIEPDSASPYIVTVTIGNLNEEVGSITYYKEQPPIPKSAMWIIIGVAIAIAIAIIIAFICYYKKSKQFRDKKDNYEKQMEQLEMEVRADFRKAFAELSIDMTDLTTDMWDSGVPCLTYRVYAMNLFFPSARYHPCMKEPDVNEKTDELLEKGLRQFEMLLNMPHFLTRFVKTLEDQHVFNNRDKNTVASLITVVLHQKLDYFTEVMKTLVADIVETGVQKNPKLVLRRTESIAERMLSNWIAICLYPFIRDTAGKSFFLLQKAIKHQVSKGPLDAITGKARYTLSDDRLLKEDIAFETLTLFVSHNTNDDEPDIVKVLTCDSIAQVKEKVMDAVYKKIPLSQRPKPDQLELEWRHGRGGHLTLPERDFAVDPTSRWRRLMTIKDYKVPNNATLALVPRQQSQFSQDGNNYPASQPTARTPMLPAEDSNAKIYHLVKYSDEIDAKRESTIPRERNHVKEMFLLRLINMRGILQSYVDDVFRAILDKSNVPHAVKHFFDFLDELATKHEIEDPDILHIWKTNGVLSRFWVTILNNSEFVFDIDKPESVESSMTVISQTFIDACSVQIHKPTPYSPINKQLYAKEIPTYKKMVHEYYDEIRKMTAFSDQDMHAHMAEISRTYDLKFNTNVALFEIWKFVNKYYEELQEALENDQNISPQVLAKLKQAYTFVGGSNP